MKLRDNLITALLAAVLCMIAPFALPLGPVPVTLATLGVYLTAALLGPWRGCAAVGLYLFLGGLGVPVFAGFTGGFPQLFGPTGGFLWGYLPCTLLVGYLTRRLPRPALLPLWLGVGAVALTAAGTVGYMAHTGAPFWGALAVCAAPVIPGELIKIAAATGLILSLRGPLTRLTETGVKTERL